ncbi:hypothetical protein BpHYR1_030550 [Brachionus plicatilis]|uniref:Uncharacterized protein n=1 Tax=Brachionus plicatilis TaxID=10195 RepID=A0A3M7RK38_BRAPC|nr:hypothetical protein BpHYR1_030550 [Brachionus plicatilis]
MPRQSTPCHCKAWAVQPNNWATNSNWLAAQLMLLLLLLLFDNQLSHVNGGVVVIGMVAVVF